MQTDLLRDWLLTYLVHSTLLLAGVWVVVGLLRRLPVVQQETLWRTALLGGLVTASAQVALGYESWSGRVEVPRALHTVSAPAPLDDLRLEQPLTEDAHIETGAAARTPIVVTPPPHAAADAERASLPWAALLATVWGAGVLAIALRRRRSRRRLARHIEHRVAIECGPLRDTLDRLRAQAGLTRPIRLSQAAGIGSPIALGTRRPEIVVPARAADELEPQQQEAMLAHELAHHVRRDPLWLAATHWIGGLLFLQPLNLLAGRRLRDTAELLADAWAVEQTGRTRELAECLTVVARWMVRGARPVPASAMAQLGSILERRVERLLRDEPPRSVRPRRGRWALAVLPLALVAVLAPAVTTGAASAQLPSIETTAPERPLPTGDGKEALRLLDAEVGLLEAEMRPLLSLLDELQDAPAALSAGVQRIRGRLVALQRQRDALAQAASASMEKNR